MSWSLHGCSGKRAEVLAKVKAQIDPTKYGNDPGVQEEITKARDGVVALVESTDSTHVSVSGSGSRHGSVSLSISTWNQAEESPAKIDEIKASQ